MIAISMLELFAKNGIDFFAGVPDSQLQPFCDFLTNKYGISPNHIITASEGNAVALAAGYHLATGKIPCVYMQNSGLGNAVNPVTSLMHPKVYGIPCVFVIGWRGEPDVHDEPQHLFQGEITLQLLDVLQIPQMVIDKDTTEAELQQKATEFSVFLEQGKSVAYVIKKGGLTNDEKVKYDNAWPTRREDIIRAVVDAAEGDIIVSTTGKTSRELFEVRKKNNQPHHSDFLTVGSMGHSSSIALGIALNKPATRVWCLDGDGAALMHMGAMALIGAQKPANLIHIVINNGAHESVGGQPTASAECNFVGVAKACGYKAAFSAAGLEDFKGVLAGLISLAGPIFIEVKTAIGSRTDLGRPTTTPAENKAALMEYLKGK